MTERDLIRKTLRESLEIQLALLSYVPSLNHRRVVEKIRKLVNEHEHLQIKTLQRALDTLRIVMKKNMKNEN